MENKLFEHKLDYPGGYILSNYPNIVTLNDSLYMICLDNGFALLNKMNLESAKDTAKVIIREVKASSRQGNYSYFQLDNSEVPIKLANSTMSIINKNESLIEIRNELLKQKKSLGTRYPDFYYKKLKRLDLKTENNLVEFLMQF